MGRVIGLLFPKVDKEPFKEVKEEVKETPQKKSTRKPKEEKED